MAPLDKSKSSLKAGKFFPPRSTTPPPRQAKVIIIDADGDEDDNDPGIYNHTIDGIGDRKHLIIAFYQDK